MPGERRGCRGGADALRVLAQLTPFGELHEGTCEEAGRRRPRALAQLLFGDARIERSILRMLFQAGGELQLELAQQRGVHVEARFAVEEHGAPELREPLQRAIGRLVGECSARGQPRR